jgi:hypothetical protein
MAKLRKPKQPMIPPVQAPPEPDVEPRETWPVPMGKRSMWDRCRPVQPCLRQVVQDHVYHLPPWQRGQVWTPAQQVAFCECLWEGLPFAPLLVWERSHGELKHGRSSVVLDGQQRLCAVGARVLRSDGSPTVPTSAFLDLETGRWGTEPSPDWPPITMRDAATMGSGWLDDLYETMDRAERRRLRMLLAHAAQRVQMIEVVTYLMGPSVPAEDAVRVFRSWNRPGTPIPEDEVEALIAQADLGWAPVQPATEPDEDP